MSSASDRRSIFTEQVRLCPHTTRSVIVFSGIGFDQGDEVPEVARRHRRVDGEHVGGGDRQRHWREVIVRIERQFGKKSRVYDVGAKSEKKGVAVRRRT